MGNGKQQQINWMRQSFGQGQTLHVGTKCIVCGAKKERYKNCSKCEERKAKLQK